MNNKIVVNTFTEGMNKDVDKSLLSNKSYLDAHNFRMITTKGNTTGSLETIKGNRLISGIEIITAGQFIVGSCEIRDQIVLFTTDNTQTSPSTGKSMIWLLTVDIETEEQLSLTCIYDDNSSSGGGYLKFSTANPIKAVSRYETPNIRKVYWTDGYNNIRYCNIANNLTVTGELFDSGVNDYMSIDKFEFLPNIIVNKPTLNNIVGGNIHTGVVAYSYQLYKTNLSTTAFSPVSSPIHVNSDSDFLDNTLNYNGDKEEVTSGKGFIINIDTTDSIGFDRLRLVRIEYPSLHSLPRIIIANEISINPLGEQLKITDTGDILGELTIDEFNLYSTELFKAEDIVIKDNILFAANIEKIDFNIGDWDARAVRFKANNTAQLFDSSDNYSVAVVITEPADPTDPADWDAAGWDQYVADHDGVNIFNDPDNDGDSASEYKFKSDGVTVGAEGVNVSIDFATERFDLDISDSATTFYASKNSTGDDLSYTNYASPWKGDKLSWQRDEVYRLFVVFGNDKGQTADPKWICDLRMPSLHDINFNNSNSVAVTPSYLAYYESSNGKVYSSILYPRIAFKRFPTGATWAQIYRVKRERKDRYVITQGLVVPSRYDSGGTRWQPHQDLSTANIATDANEIIKIVSPEINITRNISKQAFDYLEYVTDYSTVGFTAVGQNATSNPLATTHKLRTNKRIAVNATNKTNIIDSSFISPSLQSTDYVMLDGKKYTNYQHGSPSKGCSGLLVSYENTSWAAEGNSYVVVNYKSNIYGSQYGGHTYEDRLTNISIPCSDIIRYTDINTWFNVTYGDTYINFFDVTTGLADLVQTGDVSVCVAAFVPVESSINCDLRHNIDGMHFKFNNEKSYIHQEYLGTHDYGEGTVTYEQEKDLYLYNTVYSQQIDVRYAIPLDTKKIIETKFDSMIKASKKKINGELVDSWSIFGVNEYIEVDAANGPINALKLFNDNVHFFQDKACGVVSVNERSLINDKSTAQLVLGTGGVLDRYQYITTKTGSKDKFSIVTSLTGMYWYDRLSKSIYKFSNGLMNLSKAKYFQSYLTTTDVFADSDYSAIAHHDAQNDEILFTFFRENETNGFTISYNEPVDGFVSFYDFVPTIYIPYQNRYLTTTNHHYCGDSFDRDWIYLHESDLWDRCLFYSDADGNPYKFVNSTLEVLFNPDYNYTKVFDNLFYISNTHSKTLTSSAPVKQSNIDIFSNTFDYLQCYNDFQNTGSKHLVYKSNLERRERGWTLNVPRNIVSSDISTDPDIFSNVDPTQLFKERMRDKYLICYFTYTNIGVYDRFTVSNMGLKYRVSYR